MSVRPQETLVEVRRCSRSRLMHPGSIRHILARQGIAHRRAVPCAPGQALRVAAGDEQGGAVIERIWFNFELDQPHLHACACRKFTDCRLQSTPVIAQLCGNGPTVGGYVPSVNARPRTAQAACGGKNAGDTERREPDSSLPCLRYCLPSGYLPLGPIESHLTPGSVV